MLIGPVDDSLRGARVLGFLHDQTAMANEPRNRWHTCALEPTVISNICLEDGLSDLVMVCILSIDLYRKVRRRKHEVLARSDQATTELLSAAVAKSLRHSVAVRA